MPLIWTLKLITKVVSKFITKLTQNLTEMLGSPILLIILQKRSELINTEEEPNPNSLLH